MVNVHAIKGKKRSDLTTKLHLAVNTDFRIVEGFVADGNKVDTSSANETSEVIGGYVIEDKGYDAITR